jgi:hypothetical protein
VVEPQEVVHLEEEPEVFAVVLKEVVVPQEEVVVAVVVPEVEWEEE